VIRFKLILLLGFLGICLFGSISVAQDLDPSVVIYFDFEDVSGNVAKDLSNTGNDGTIVGAKQVDGVVGKALEFDGAGAHVMVPDNATIDITDGITLMSWIYKTEFVPANNGETMISKKQGGAYCLEVTGWENRFPEKLSAEPRILGTYHPVSSPDPLPLNEWVHTAMTYDGDSIRLYINGEMVTEEQWPGKIDVNGANLYVGAESDGGQIDATHGKFKGLIDEVLVANRGFSEDEIRAFMNKAAPVDSKDKLSVTWGDIKGN
jgi:hypothetical protein